jgi:hypothetical protein
VPLNLLMWVMSSEALVGPANPRKSLAARQLPKLTF